MNDDNATRSVFDTVAGMVREIIGAEWADELDIGLTTRFSADLELESIEFVALAERLRKQYGKAVDFPKWLAGMNLKSILDLTVGDLVRYIESCTSQPTTA